MPSVEELLNSDEQDEQIETYAEENEELVIDAETRVINIPESEVLFGVKGDKNIERKYFRCPKIVGDNVDLSKHLIYIAYVYTESNSGSIFPTVGIQPYHCDDVKIDGDDITFSWKLSENVFQSAGFIVFKMYAKEKEDSPYTVFNTAPAVGTVLYTIGDGVESIVSEYPDIINQLLAKMESVQEIATPEAMQNYVNAYLKENPVQGGMTEEQKQQLEKNTQDITNKLDKNQGTENAGKILGIGDDGNIIAVDMSSGNEDEEDTFLGTLPMMIEKSGSYLISNKNATISTGEGAEQILNMNDADVVIQNGIYNSIDPERTQILTENSIKLMFLADGKNAVVYINDIQIQSGKTYTIALKILDTNMDGEIVIIRTTNQDNTYQVSSNKLNVDYFKAFTASKDTVSLMVQILASSIKTTDDYMTISLYIYEGEYSELPSGSMFEVSANVRYNLDSFIGMTLSTVTEGATIKVYQDNSVKYNNGVLFFGDSIFARSNIDVEYTKRTGKPALSLAVGGTRLTASREPENEYYVYDMANVADAIANNDFSLQVSGGMQSNYSALDGGNIESYGTMVFEYGTNDYTAKVTFEGESSETIKGATKHIIETILNKYPSMRLVFLSTQPYVTTGSGSESGVPNHNDGTVWQMNEVIKDVCETYNVAFVDLYHIFGENSITRNILTSDGVHLMAGVGITRYADIMTAQLNAIGV